MRNFWLPVLLLLLAVSARAELVYVDTGCGSITTYNPTASPGSRCSGGSARSYGTIANALAYSGLGGSDDDQVLIRSGTYSENPTMSGKNGTSGHQVLIRPYQSETVTINSSNSGGSGGCLVLLNSSYVTVQGLSFIGTGRNTPRWALQSRATTADVNGVIITGNTFTNWGTGASDNRSAAVQFESADGVVFVNRNFSVTNNTITGQKWHGVFIRSSYDGLIDGNDIGNVVCGSDGTDTGAIGIKLAGSNQGIGASTQSARITVSNNVVHDLQERSACAIVTNGFPRGIYGDVAATFAIIKKNTVYNISPSSTNTEGVAGIEIESRCNDWTVEENVIYKVGGIGIRNGSQTHEANRTKIINNTIYSVKARGILFSCGKDSVVKSNAIRDAANGQIAFYDAAVTGTSGCSHFGGHTVDHNGYYDSLTTTKIGTWGHPSGAAASSFSIWKSESGKDSNAINDDPKFQSITPGSENFHLQSGSTFIGSGSGGVDMGAYPLGSGTTPPPDEPPFSIDVTSPNGGEFLTPGTVFPITYTSNALIGFTIAAFSHNAVDPGEDSTAGPNQTVISNTHRSEASFLVEYGTQQTLSASWATNNSNAGMGFAVTSSSATVTCDDCSSSSGGVSNFNIVTGKTPLGNTPYLVIVSSMISAGSPPPVVNEPTLTGTNGWNVTWTRPVNGTITHNQSGGTQHRITAFQSVIGNSPASGNLIIDFGGQTQTRTIWSVLRLPDADRTTPLSEVKSMTDAAGTSMDMVMSSAPSSGGLKIEFSQDNGVNYSTIASSVSNTGVYYWTVPRGASTNCKIRISAAADSSNNDVSDAVFQIKGRYLGASQ